MTWHRDNYSNHWVCIKCCSSYKCKWNLSPIAWRGFKKDKAYDFGPGPSCPSCGRKGIAAGHDFRAPKKSNKKEWKRIIKMLQHGIKFNAGCDFLNGYRFRTMDELNNFISGPNYYYFLNFWKYTYLSKDPEIINNYQREKKKFRIKQVKMTPYQLKEHNFISKNIIY